MAAPGAIRIATRGSPLALWQARRVRDLLLAAHAGRLSEDQVEIEVVRTTGDAVRDRPLADIGGKGLFTKEIDAAILAGRVELAVHSLKDLETVLPEGIALAAVPEREDPRDALITRDGGTLADLAAGARVGTTSLRRQAQIRHLRPDLEIVLFRGNVETRLRKLREGEAEATILALSGLKRLGLEQVAAEIMALDRMLPAVGQGALAITCRSDDDETRSLLASLDDAHAATAVAAERAMLAALDGSCHTPIAGLATLDGHGALHLRGLVAEPDGSRLFRGERRGAASDGVALGSDLGDELRAAAGEAFFEDGQ